MSTRRARPVAAPPSRATRPPSVPSGLAGRVAGWDDVGVSSVPTVTRAPAPAVTRTPADEVMRRLLRVDDAAPRLGEEELRRGFSQSMLVSAVRCVITYLVIPFLGPVIGLAAGVGPIVGIPVGALAIAFNIKSMRRFWRADHRFRWHYTVVGGLVVAMLVVLIAIDLVELLG